MQTTVQINCCYCGAEKQVIAAEYKRQKEKGVNRFFCSRSCSAKQRNDERANRHVEVTRTCPQCNTEFVTHTGPKGATYCSRACASAGSVTEARRNAGRQAGKLNFIHGTEQSALALRSRESWKYDRLKKLLRTVDERYVFEYAVAAHVFDLALPDHKTLVEFDGGYHTWSEQIVADTEKAQAATALGWTVVRIATGQNEVIGPEVLFDLLKSFKSMK